MPTGLEATLKQFSHHAKGVARLNNGSFGAVPGRVLARQRDLSKEWLAQPDAMYFNPSASGLTSRLVDASRGVAKWVGASHDEVCLVENASVAVAAVAHRWAWDYVEGRAKQGDSILMLNHAYGAVFHTMRAVCERAGAHIVQAALPFPVRSESSVVDVIIESIETHRPRYILIDHITSQPSMVIPMLPAIVAHARRHGVAEVCVDGAHAIGVLPRAEINVKTIGADFYFSNLHKWAMAPPCATMLYCRRGLATPTHHPIVSWKYPEGIIAESCWAGTRDYSSMLAVPEALNFLDQWRSPCGRDAQEYNQAMCAKQAARLADEWNTEQGIPDSMSSSMTMVRLPMDVTDRPGMPDVGTRRVLREKYQIEAAVGCFGDQGSWIRLSHAIYNTCEDYERLSCAVREIAAEQG